MKQRSRRRIVRMRRVLAGLAGAAIAAGGFASPVGAQEEPARVNILAVDSSGHPEVTLTVEPPAALADEDLGAEAFRLTENGEPVSVSVARVGSDQAPAVSGPALEVVMVVDTSGSMQGEPLQAAKQAAAAFLAQMPEGTRIAVVAFGDTPAVVSPPSTDIDAALAAVASLEANGETALYDALNVALAQFGEAADGAQRSLVVLSDGGDTASTATLEATAQALAGAGVEFSAVELVTAEYDGSALRTLAGGEEHIISADEPGKLVSSYEAVASDLLNRYTVTYETALGGATRIELVVEWAGVSAATARDIRLPAIDGPVTVDAPTATVVEAPGWFGTKAALYTGLGLFFAVAMALLAWALTREREAKVSLAGRFGLRARRPQFAALSEWAGRAGDAAQRRLEASGRDSALYAALERAGIELRPGEFVVMAIGSGIAGLLVGFIFAGPLAALVLAAMTAGAFPVVLRYKGKKRQSLFAEQLADTLQLITGSLRAGQSILQAMDSVATDAPSPTQEEFHRVVVETRLGRELRDALRAMHGRIGNQDFEWFVQALEIHREVGGDLAEILDTVANTVRERSRLRRHVRTLSAEGRLSAVILFILPVAVAVFVSIINPGYMAELFNTGTGVGLLVVAGCLMTTGFFWLRKMVRLEF